MNYEQTARVLEQESRDASGALRKRAWFVGIAMLLTQPLQYLLSMLIGPFLVRAESLMAQSATHRLLYYVLYAGFYCTLMLLPVVISALLFRQRPLLPHTVRRRVAPLEGVLLVLFGLGFCLLANYITNYWLMFAGQFGVQPQQGDYHSAVGWLPFVLNLITYAVLPAILEELVFRGWFLSALQPGGERRALILSALLFGLAHENLTQLPFAFMLGLLFGWLYLRTGHLWVTMLLHFLNNALSVVFDTASVYLSEANYHVLQLALYAVLILAGTVAAVLLAVHPAFRDSVRPMRDRRSVLSERRRRQLTWGNPAVVLTMVVYVASTLLGEWLL